MKHECLRVEPGWPTDCCRLQARPDRCSFTTQPQAAAIAQHRSAHASPISAIAFSGDGAKLATADAEGTIKIWADARKLTSKSTALCDAQGPSRGDHNVGFSSDGKRLVSTSADKTARVWDLENAGAAIRPLERFPLVIASWRDFRPMGNGSPPPTAAACVCGTPPRGDSCGNCRPATRVGSQRGILAHRQPPAGCRVRRTSGRFVCLRCGTSMPARNLRGCRERPICPTSRWAKITGRSVRWRFRPTGNIWSPVSAQSGSYIVIGVLPIR